MRGNTTGYPRHEYLALDNESSFVSDRLELSRKLRGDIDRNEALINCQYYLRGSTRYFLRYQLCNIGSRMDRHWFVVRDSATRTERLLTVTALPDACPLRHSPCQVRPGLLEIFLGLQHPYVHPVLDIDIKVLAERPHVVVVSPLNDVGSLKDLIYHSRYNEDWQEKYRPQGTGLPEPQVQRLAKQIVEGLLFLHEKDFPAFYNLHLGNVILQNGVARPPARCPSACTLVPPVLHAGHWPRAADALQMQLGLGALGEESVTRCRCWTQAMLCLKWLPATKCPQPSPPTRTTMTWSTAPRFTRFSGSSLRAATTTTPPWKRLPCWTSSATSTCVS